MSQWKYLYLGLIFTLFLTAFTTSPVHANTYQTNPMSYDKGMQSMRIMIAKLRDLILNVRDINELEKIGLSASDATLMRVALQAKIKQTQHETIQIIKEL